MKQFAYIFLLMISMAACKSNEEANLNYGIDSYGITGTWRLTGVEQGAVGQNSSWVDLSADSTKDVIFRYDFVLMTPTGLPACCAPTSLTINGNFVEIKPTTALAPNPDCSKINCTNCLIWDLKLSGNEMIISRCNTPRARYKRIK